MAATIQAIPLGIDNVYVVKDERVILVDGGVPGTFAPFARRLREAGVSTRDIGLIVATHGHLDHIGCLAEMKQHTGAPLAPCGCAYTAWEPAERRRTISSSTSRSRSLPK